MLSFIIPFLFLFLIAEWCFKYFKVNQENLAKSSVPLKSSIHFSFYRQSKMRNFINYILGIKNYSIDNSAFDEKVFISCDYEPIIKIIKDSETVQNIILFILQEDMVSSINCENNRLIIKLKLKYHTSDKLKDALAYVSTRLVPELNQIKDYIETDVIESIKKAPIQVQKELRNVERFLDRNYLFLLSFFTAIMGQVLYNGISNDFTMIDKVWSFPAILLGLTIFIGFLFYFRVKLYNSIRIHLLYWGTIILLPSSIALSCHFIYAINYSFAFREPEIKILPYTKKTSHGNKTVTYFYETYIPEINKSVKVKISREEFYRFNTKYSQITYQKGVLGYHFVTSVSPYQK